MVETVEELRELVDVLGEQRKLEIRDRLADDVAPAGTLQHQLPEIVSDLCAG